MSVEYWAQSRSLEEIAEPSSPPRGGSAPPREAVTPPPREAPSPPPREAPAGRVAPQAPMPMAGPGPGAGPGSAPRGGRSLVQVFALLVGLAFAAVGVLGFVPGVTTSFGDLALAGRSSGAELLDLFRVSVAHNAVHLLFAVGIVAAARAGWSKLYLLAGGVVYLAVWVYGSVIDLSSGANFLPFNSADNVLHLVLAVAMIALGDRKSTRLNSSH